MHERLKEFMQDEHDGYERYMEEAKSCRETEGHEDAAKVFEDLANEELSHYNILKELECNANQMLTKE